MKNITSKPSRKSDKKQKKQNPGISEFWDFDNKGVVKINHYLFIEFLEINGFFTYQNGDGYELIRCVGNVVEIITAKEIKDFTRKYLIGIKQPSVLAQLVKGSNRYFGRGVLEFLGKIELDLLKDTEYKAFFVYKNVVATVTKYGIKAEPHTDIEKHIWKSQIINRNFDLCKDAMGGDFARFVLNTTDKNVEKFGLNRRALGYLLHNHHNPTNPKAIIINDSDVNIDQPKGGRGKGLYLKAVAQLRTSTVEDGKTWTPYKNFAYQKIQPSTQIFVLEDLSKKFDFECLFPVLTDGISVERKNQNSYTIEPHNLPKLAITTNYAVDRDGGSFERRMHDIELTSYYSSTHRPIDDFGGIFFSGWKSEEWQKFDNFMLDCVRLYFLKGLGESSQDMGFKLLRENVNEGLLDYFDVTIKPITTSTVFLTNEVMEVVKAYDTTLSKLTSKGLYASLRKYCKYYPFKFEKNKFNGQRGFIIAPTDAMASPSPSVDDVPF